MNFANSANVAEDRTIWKGVVAKTSMVLNNDIARMWARLHQTRIDHTVKITTFSIHEVIQMS